MKFNVDYGNLDNSLNQPKFYRYAEVQDKLVKVAFDVVRFRESDNIDGLWQIQQTDDGEVIVATYGEPVGEVKQSSAKVGWEARANKAGTNVTIFYRDEPVTKISIAQYGISPSEAELVCSYLPNKLAENNNMKKMLLSAISTNERQELFKKFPELSE